MAKIICPRLLDFVYFLKNKSYFQVHPQQARMSPGSSFIFTVRFSLQSDQESLFGGELELNCFYSIMMDYSEVGIPGFWLAIEKRFHWLKIILVKNRIYFSWLVENSSRDCQHIQRPIRSVSIQDNHPRLDHMSVRSNGLSHLPDNYDPIRIRAACNLQIRKWIRWNKS